MPKATPISPKSDREKVPMVSWRFSLIITLRWLERKPPLRAEHTNPANLVKAYWAALSLQNPDMINIVTSQDLESS